MAAQTPFGKYGDVRLATTEELPPTPPDSGAGPGPVAVSDVQEFVNGFPVATTGRILVVFEPGHSMTALSSLKDKAGLDDIASSVQYSSGAFELAEVQDTEVLHLDALDVAIVKADPDKKSALSSLASTGGARIQKIIPERYVVLADGAGADQGTLSREYLDGWIDALKTLRDSRFGSATPLPGEKLSEVSAANCFQDIPTATWGLQAMGVPDSKWTGKGIKIAILDTGFDLKHPDFAGRNIIAQSISGATTDGQDIHGHGTHCAGTAGGGQGLHGRRYGIASECDLYIGQVFGSRNGSISSVDGDIWAGINWAVKQGCHIVSMSLERFPGPVRQGEPFNTDYEDVASRALNAGTLLFAAGGNHSSRPNTILPVNQPANSPSIIAVGSLGQCLGVSSFSPRAINLNGGRVDFAAPGEAVISSWPMPLRYQIEQGTSMATPHAAGVAALIAQAFNVRGVLLWKRLAESCRGLGLDAGDVGFGLPMAPS